MTRRWGQSISKMAWRMRYSHSAVVIGRGSRKEKSTSVDKILNNQVLLIWEVYASFPTRYKQKSYKSTNFR